MSEYETKTVNENGYEAQRKFIDIQYLLKGWEKNCCLPNEKLKETKAYSEENMLLSKMQMSQPRS